MRNSLAMFKKDIILKSSHAYKTMRIKYRTRYYLKNFYLVHIEDLHKLPFFYIVIKKEYGTLICYKIKLDGQMSNFKKVKLSEKEIKTETYAYCITSDRDAVLNEFFKIKQRKEVGVFTPKF